MVGPIMFKFGVCLEASQQLLLHKGRYMSDRTIKLVFGPDPLWFQ